MSSTRNMNHNRQEVRKDQQFLAFTRRRQAQEEKEEKQIYTSSTMIINNHSDDDNDQKEVLQRSRDDEDDISDGEVDEEGVHWEGWPTKLKNDEEPPNAPFYCTFNDLNSCTTTFSESDEDSDDDDDDEDDPQEGSSTNVDSSLHEMFDLSDSLHLYSILPEKEQRDTGASRAAHGRSQQHRHQSNVWSAFTNLHRGKQVKNEEGKDDEDDEKRPTRSDYQFFLQKQHRRHSCSSVPSSASAAAASSSGNNKEGNPFMVEVKKSFKWSFANRNNKEVKHHHHQSRHVLNVGKD